MNHNVTFFHFYRHGPEVHVFPQKPDEKVELLNGTNSFEGNAVTTDDGKTKTIIIDDAIKITTVSDTLKTNAIKNLETLKNKYQSLASKFKFTKIVSFITSPMFILGAVVLVIAFPPFALVAVAVALLGIVILGAGILAKKRQRQSNEMIKTIENEIPKWNKTNENLLKLRKIIKEKGFCFAIKNASVVTKSELQELFLKEMQEHDEHSFFDSPMCAIFKNKKLILGNPLFEAINHIIEIREKKLIQLKSEAATQRSVVFEEILNKKKQWEKTVKEIFAPIHSRLKREYDTNYAIGLTKAKDMDLDDTTQVLKKVILKSEERKEYVQKLQSRIETNWAFKNMEAYQLLHAKSQNDLDEQCMDLIEKCMEEYLDNQKVPENIDVAIEREFPEVDLNFKFSEPVYEKKAHNIFKPQEWRELMDNLKEKASLINKVD